MGIMISMGSQQVVMTVELDMVKKMGKNDKAENKFDKWIL